MVSAKTWLGNELDFPENKTVLVPGNTLPYLDEILYLTLPYLPYFNLP